MIATAQSLILKNRTKEAAGLAFFWLSAFYLVYCGRPEDWIAALGYVPMAKITALGAFLALLFGTRKAKRHFRDLPRESYYLLAIIGVLILSALLTPVWKGGAFFKTLGFSKLYVVWILTFLLVTNLERLRRIMFLQAATVPTVCLLAIIKGHNRPRLEGAGGGFYSNPNDLAFAIVLSLPLCLMFLLNANGAFRKLLWAAGMLVMCLALFMTASRGGFVTLLFAGAASLWQFGVKGKRYYLIAISALVTLVLFGAAGGLLKDRFTSIWSDSAQSRQEMSAHESYEARKELIIKAFQGIEHYPILGIGTGNFEPYSGSWQEVHMTYLEIAVEGGIPTLILYLLFYARGFWNVKQIFKRKNLSPEFQLFAGALQASLVGFVVGALFSPEAYQFFPYFAIAYTAALLALVKESEQAPAMIQETVSPLRRSAYTRAGVVSLHP